MHEIYMHFTITKFSIFNFLCHFTRYPPNWQLVQ